MRGKRREKEICTQWEVVSLSSQPPKEHSFHAQPGEKHFRGGLPTVGSATDCSIFLGTSPPLGFLDTSLFYSSFSCALPDSSPESLFGALTPEALSEQFYLFLWLLLHFK